jgi:hypothetical protein
VFKQCATAPKKNSVRKLLIYPARRSRLSTNSSRYKVEQHICQTEAGMRVAALKDGDSLQCGATLDQRVAALAYMCALLLGSAFILITLFLAYRTARRKQRQGKPPVQEADGNDASGGSSVSIVSVDTAATEHSRLLASVNSHDDSGTDGEVRKLGGPTSSALKRAELWAESRLFRGDEARARFTLVFPIYFHVLWLTVIILVSRGVMLVFLDRKSLLYGFGYLGVFNGLTSFAREGVACFFVSRSCGRDAVRRSAIVGGLWGACQAALGVVFFFFPDPSGASYLDTNPWYFVSHDGSIAVFEGILFLIMLVRRNERIGPWHRLYSGFFTLCFIAFVVSDMAAVFELAWFPCSALLIQFMLYSSWAPIVYAAVRGWLLFAFIF